MTSIADAYQLAQRALADLKAAILNLLQYAGATGLTNAEILRALGIYQGHVGHEGHIPRTLLGMMELEGVVKQDHATKKWTFCRAQRESSVRETLQASEHDETLDPSSA